MCFCAIVAVLVCSCNKEPAEVPQVGLDPAIPAKAQDLPKSGSLNLEGANPGDTLVFNIKIPYDLTYGGLIANRFKTEWGPMEDALEFHGMLYYSFTTAKLFDLESVILNQNGDRFERKYDMSTDYDIDKFCFTDNFTAGDYFLVIILNVDATPIYKLEITCHPAYQFHPDEDEDDFGKTDPDDDDWGDFGGGFGG